MVRRSADHLSGLIDGILDISKIEAGRLYLSRDEVRLSEFLDQLVGMFRLQAAAKGIDFVFRAAGGAAARGLCRRKAAAPDPDQPAVQRDQVHADAAACNSWCITAARSPSSRSIDTGPGIQPDDLERIFAPFERGALGVSQPQTGTGLGLTISRLLAGVMGGDIKVVEHGRPGQHLPREDPAVGGHQSDAASRRSKRPSPAITGARKTILVTDDDPVQRDLLREVLTPLGFILLSAPDGPGCLALAQHCRPDLFLLDISMPGMDGWKVAETLRATGHHQARILMVSASALEAHGTPLAQPYHDGYLMKPIDIPRLLETIRQLLKLEWTLRRPTRSVAPRWQPETGSRPPVAACRGADRPRPDRLCPRHPGQARRDRQRVSRTRRLRRRRCARLVDRFDLDQYMATLKTLHAYDH